MKKNLLRKILPLTLAFVLMFSSLAYGAEASAVKVDTAEEALPSIEETQEIPNSLINGLKKSSLKSAGSSFSVGSTSSYNTLVSWMKSETNYSGYQFSQNASSGYLTFKAPKTGNMIVIIGAYDTNAGSVQVKQRSSTGSDIAWVSTGLKPGYMATACIPVQSGKTYQLYIAPANAGDAFIVKGGMVPGATSGTLPTKYATGDYTVAAGTNASNKAYTTYWKLKVKKNGRLNVSATDIWGSSQGVSVTLCNSKKKAISATSSLKNYSYDGTTYVNHASYGVSGTSKGTTYYLKVTTKAPIYALKYATANYTTKPGTKKSKATKITRGKSKNVTLAASTSTGSQWYKISIPAKKTCTINFNGYIAPGTSVKMSLLKSNGKTTVKSVKMTGALHSVNTGYIKDIYVSKKGTYYVKITKSSKKSSAAYNLSFK